MEANNLFLLNPKNKAVLNGKRKRPGRKERPRHAALSGLLGALLTIAALWLLADPFGYLTGAFRLSLSPVRTEAFVSDRRFITTDEGERIYTVEYVFTADEAEFTRIQEVTKAVFDSTVDAELVDVVYLPGSPEVSRLAGSGIFPLDSDRLSFLPVGVVLLVLGIMAMAGGIRSVRRQLARPRAHGEVIAARLTRCEGIPDRSDYVVAISYTFLSPESGAWLTGSAARSRRDLRGADLPERGEAVAVYYVSDETFDAL